MTEIDLQVQNSVDAVLKCLDKLPTTARNSAIEEIRHLLAQKYGNCSAEIPTELPATDATNVYRELGGKKRRKTYPRRKKCSVPVDPAVESNLTIADLRVTEERPPMKRNARKKDVSSASDTRVDGDINITDLEETVAAKSSNSHQNKVSVRETAVSSVMKCTDLKDAPAKAPRRSYTRKKKVSFAIDVPIDDDLEQEDEKVAPNEKCVWKKKVLITSERPLHSDLKISLVENVTVNEDSLKTRNDEFHEQFVNVIVVDLNSTDNSASTESAISQVNSTNKNEKGLKGYFIKYPIVDKNSKAEFLKNFEKCLENNERIMNEINVDIHCQKPPREKRQYKTEMKTCSICSNSFKNQRDYMEHMKKEHEKQLKCTACGKGFHFAAGLRSHEKRHTGIRDFECDFCSFKTYTKSDIRRHMLKHKKIRNFVCQYCGKLFTFEATLRVHVKTMHERDEKYPCDQCTFSTYHKPNLRTHVQVHHTAGDAVYKITCPVCHVRIQQKSTYIDHMRSHTGERPFSCSRCSSNFACLSRLNAHMKTVHSPRQFPCTECKKTFQSTHHLQRHLLIHTKERPYSCPKCKHTSNTQGNLTKHMKNTHHISDFSFRKSKRHVAYEDSAAIDESIEKGKIVSEKYLAELSVKSGRTVTLKDLKKLEEEKLSKPKQKVMSIKEQMKNEQRTKFEHSYHLEKCTEVSLIENVLPDVDIERVSESERLCVDQQSVTGTVILSCKQSDKLEHLDKHSKHKDIDPKTPNSISLRLNDRTDGNIYQDLADESNCAEQLVSYGELAEDMCVENAVTENIETTENKYMLYEVNDDESQVCQSDYTNALDTPETHLSCSEDYILMINDGNILIIEDP